MRTNCGNCQIEINRKPYNIKRSKHLYCSMNCRNKHYSITKPLENNSGWYGKGHKSWNDGVKGIHLSPETEFKSIGYTFKGTKKEYFALHYWVNRVLGKPDKCELCGNDGLIKHQIHWANISKMYKREESDWIRLCAKCHFYYDGREKLLT